MTLKMYRILIYDRSIHARRTVDSQTGTMLLPAGEVVDGEGGEDNVVLDPLMVTAVAEMLQLLTSMLSRISNSPLRQSKSYHSVLAWLKYQLRSS